MTEPSDTIVFRNSPGVEVTVERGGTDAVTGDPRPEQWVRLSWTNPETSETEVREFLGP